MVGEQARLFIAVWPPPVVLDAIARLPWPAVEGVRYTTRDQWHLTLRFLGNADIDEAQQALATAVQTVAAILARLPTEALPSALRDRVP